MENKQTFHTDALTVDVPGTAQQFTAHRVVQGHYLTVHAIPTNTSNIYVGETKAQAEANNFTLTPDASAQIAIDNCSDIWIDAVVADEGAEIIVEVDNVDA